MAKKRIAILGGGLGALSTAFELTSRPNWRDRYEIDVYQKGWRLGGKGASGRNAGESQRIEEHGLHCFWGFYDHAFWMMHEVYKELNAADGFMRWLDDPSNPCFIPLDYVHFMDKKNGTFRRWTMTFPKRAGVPGDAPPRTFDLSDVARQVIDALEEIFKGNADVAHPFDAAAGGDAIGALRRVEQPWAYAAKLDTFRATGPHEDAIALLDKLSKVDTKAPLPGPVTLMAAKLADGDDGDYRREIISDSIKVVLIALKGMLVEGVPTCLEDFSRFDDRDLGAWLTQHGASRDLVASEPVTGLYNSSFCHPRGDFQTRDIAAGVCLRALLVMGLAYKGSFMWKMRAGMGDTIFAPLYRVLSERGVRFHFFHRVKKLRLDEGKHSVATIELDVQARTQDGSGYDPLVRVCGLHCWPSEPKWDLLEPATARVDFESDWADVNPRGSLTLRAGAADGFDYVVVATSIAPLRTIASELLDASPAWRAMVDNVLTVRTQSVQVWVDKSDAQTKWQDATHVMTDVYEDPYNSIADMYQTLWSEDWPAATEPGGVVYFSTPMEDDPTEPTKPSPAYPGAQNTKVKETWTAWMRAYEDGVFGWLAPGQPLGIRSLYTRANIDADSRYVLSVAKSTAHRVFPESTGFANVWIAGDWTKSPYDLGCAENATASGMRAGDTLARTIERGVASFIEAPGMPVFAPPYRQKDLVLVQLLLDASPTSMQSVLDRYLNPAAGGKPFRALGRWVILQLGYIGQNRGAQPDTNFGTASETSASFLLPCARWTRRLELGFFSPLILVDHPLSLVAGREVLGMNKQLARFTARGPDDLDELTVSTTTSACAGPDSPIDWRDILRVRRSGPKAEPRRMVRSLFTELASSRTMTFFDVRQQRDLDDPSRASAQQLTRGRMRLGRVVIEPLASGHAIEIVPQASHPIARLFGFSGGVLEPVMSAKFRIDEATLDVEP